MKPIVAGIIVIVLAFSVAFSVEKIYAQDEPAPTEQVEAVPVPELITAELAMNSLKVLEIVSQEYKGTLKQHQEIIQSIRTLAKFINENTIKEDAGL